MAAYSGQPSFLDRAQHARPVLAQGATPWASLRLAQSIQQNDWRPRDLPFPDLSYRVCSDSRLFCHLLECNPWLFLEGSHYGVITSDVNGIGSRHGSPIAVFKEGVRSYAYLVPCQILALACHSQVTLLRHYTYPAESRNIHTNSHKEVTRPTAEVTDGAFTSSTIGLADGLDRAFSGVGKPVFAEMRE